jgi:SAM-dependent methyltransferase
MLEGLSRRAEKEDLQQRIRLHRAVQNRIGVEGSFDLALAFWMVHEVHDRESFISQIRSLLRPGGKLLIAEPYLHVSRDDFLQTSRILQKTGFKIIDQPKIGFSRTLVAAKE